MLCIPLAKHLGKCIPMIIVSQERLSLSTPALPVRTLLSSVHTDDQLQIRLVLQWQMPGISSW